MSVVSPLYKDFKPYSYYKNVNNEEPKKKKSYLPLIGSALGAGLSYAYYAKKYKGVSEKEIGAIKTGLKFIVMCASSLIGGVAFGSIGAKPDSIRRKIKEGIFQMMNMAIPMTFVSLFNHAAQNIKSLDKPAIKVIGSLAALVSGASLASAITNGTRDKNQPKRKYTIKDTFTHFDDIAAATAIGFGKELTEKQNFVINAAIPFIYAYNGMRAGQAE